MMGTNYQTTMPIIPADSDPLLSPTPQEQHNLLHDSHEQNTLDDVNLITPLDINPLQLQSNHHHNSPIHIPSNTSKSPNTESSSEYIRINVSCPQKELDSSVNSIVPGNTTFVSYLVSTKTDFKEFGGKEFVVRRRFKDVVTLSERLSESYRGFFIPPRPDKSVVESQKELDSSVNAIVPGNSTFVSTKTDFKEFGGKEFVVRRRFKDFVTLSERLAESYHGFFIPPRPDKSVVESQVMQKQEFVEQRCVALEKYLRRLASHPVIKKSDEFRIFLQAQGRMPLPTSTDVASRMLDGAVSLPRQILSGTGVVDPEDAVQPARGGRDLLRIFKELKQSVTNDWVGGKPVVEEEDKEFLEKKEKLRDLEKEISGTSHQAEVLVKSQQRMAETMGELGLALIKLTKFENENAQLNTQRIRASDMKNVATVTVKGSRLYRGLNAQTVQHLDTLHEYLGLMLAVDAAFSDRSSALLTVQTLISELSALQSKADKHETASSKIFGNDRNKVHKVEELRERIKATENAKSCAIREYERIKENNRNEIERLDKERKKDFLNMMKEFVTNQVAYTEKVAVEWTKVAEGTSHYAKESC